MIWKKLFVIILVAGLMIPVSIVGQKGAIDDEFSREVSESWEEAVTIWGQMYDTARSFWYRHLGWRLAPVWNRTKRWIDGQVAILRDALREDTERAGEAIKEEVTQTGESVSKSIWQMILEAAGIGEKE